MKGDFFFFFPQNLYIDFILSQVSFTQFSHPHTHKYQVFWPRPLVCHAKDKGRELLSRHHISGVRLDWWWHKLVFGQIFYIL